MPAAASISVPATLNDPSNSSNPSKKALPAGQPREWYVSHNRRLKAMRLAIALLDTGVYTPVRPTTARYVPRLPASACIRRPTPPATWSVR